MKTTCSFVAAWLVVLLASGFGWAASGADTGQASPPIQVVGPTGPYYTLTVLVAPPGAGNVGKKPPTVTSNYLVGTTVILTANHNPGYTFTSWTGTNVSGSATTLGTDTSIKVTVTNNMTVTANFHQTIFYTLTLQRNPPAGGNVTPKPQNAQNRYAEGTLVTLTEKPAAGYTFANWTGSANGIATSVPVTMTNNLIVVANFNRIPPPPQRFSLNIKKIGIGTGWVFPNPLPGSDRRYAAGTPVTLTEDPVFGSFFKGWGGAAAAFGAATTANVIMTNNLSVTADFEKVAMWSLSLSTAGTGYGTLTGKPFGSLALPAVSDVQSDGVSDVPWNGTWFGMQSFVSTAGACSAYVTTTNALTLSVSGGVVSGTWSVDGLPCFDKDCFIDGYPTVTGPVSGTTSGNAIHLDLSGTVSGGLCNGESCQDAFTGTLTGLSTLIGTTAGGRTVTYGKTSPLDTSREEDLAGAVAGQTTDSPRLSETFTNGEEVQLTATPDSGSTFVGWSGAVTGTDPTVTLVMNGNKSVTATFNRIPSGGGVAGTWSMVLQDETATLTVNASGNFTGSGWYFLDTEGNSYPISITNGKMVANGSMTYDVSGSGGGMTLTGSGSGTLVGSLAATGSVTFNYTSPLGTSQSTGTWIAAHSP